jgi:hypothetical protein
MATIYGTYDPVESTRTLVAAELNLLKADMVTNSIDPAIDTVYTTHFADPDLSFNAVSIGVSTVENEFPAVKSDPGGPYITTFLTVDLRVMIGNRNNYMDEIKISRLCTSIMNWMQENRALDSDHRVWDTVRFTLGDIFDDTDTIGGTVSFVVRSCHLYTAA